MDSLKRYRAKRKDNNEWIESKSINTQTDVNGKEHIYMGLPVKSEQHPKMVTVEWVEVESDTISLETGVKDKNGKDIWQFNECRLTTSNTSHATARGYIDFINGSYAFVEYIYHTVVFLSELSLKGFEVEVVIDWFDKNLAKI